MDHPVDTRRGEQPVLFNPVGKAEGHIIMAEELARMRIERHGSGGDTGFPRRVDCRFNDLAVAAMDPVEIPDGRNAGPNSSGASPTAQDTVWHLLSWLWLIARHYIVQRQPISTPERAKTPATGDVAAGKMPHAARQRLALAGPVDILGSWRGVRDMVPAPATPPVRPDAAGL
ncbi:MAG: hypothetical protein CM15mP115_10450 [Alphaproteobacteria bacterium]|nr:MAG: hypothetical protein CM15mP115_10450 [Alphaproteobacteria bacterium]